MFKIMLFFRHSERLTFIFVSISYRLDSVHQISGYTATLEDWQPETTNECLIRCMIATGMRCLSICKSMCCSWLRICSDPFNIMALELLFWIWRHFARWKVFVIDIILGKTNFQHKNMEIIIYKMNVIIFLFCFTVDSSGLYELHALQDDYIWLNGKRQHTIFSIFNDSSRGITRSNNHNIQFLKFIIFT